LEKKQILDLFFLFPPETIQVFEYLRTMERDLRERFPEVVWISINIWEIL